MDLEFEADVRLWVQRKRQQRDEAVSSDLSAERGTSATKIVTLDKNSDGNVSSSSRRSPHAVNKELPVRAPAAVRAAKLADASDELETEGTSTMPLCWADPWDEERKAAAVKMIKQQGEYLTPFWQDKYKAEAGKYWHLFYKRNTDNFYKDRHYLRMEFPELLLKHDASVTVENRLQLLEVGCGVGNAVVPLLDINPNLYVNAIDFARSAIEILRQHKAVAKYPGRLIANVCNVIADPLPLPSDVFGQLDMVLCMFVISAISPEHQLGAFRKLATELKPGGKLLFRDYGRYDEAQLRFKKGSKVQENLYVRNDGTLAFYFELNELTALCKQAGLKPVEDRCGYIRIAQANRQQGVSRHRVFVQAVFEKE